MGELNHQLTLAIQAGGASSRMGTDKGLLNFDGRTLIEHVIDRGKSLTDNILVTTNRLEDYRFLQVPLFADALPIRGALAGLYTALSTAPCPFVAVIACDMPFFNPSLLAYEMEILAANDQDVVIPLSSTGHEPLHAVYRRETCLPLILASLAREEYKLVTWMRNARTTELPVEKVHEFDPEELCFFNVNTPEELAKAKEMYLHHDPGHSRYRTENADDSVN